DTAARVVSCVFAYPGSARFVTLSLHDALPIWDRGWRADAREPGAVVRASATARTPARGARWRRSARRASRGPGSRAGARDHAPPDRKSTRLNSSHDQISYAVFCLKKKTTNQAQ